MSIEFTPGFRERWPIRHVLFDFDGTLSLVRTGWEDVMTKMFAEHLPGEHELAREHILRLNGQPTIQQMAWLAAELQTRGKTAAPAANYLEEFRRRLEVRIEQRLSADRESLLVHGARQMLEMLRTRGLILHLASGTDAVAVRREAGLLGVAAYFEDRIHGAPADERPYSKLGVIESMLRDYQIAGEALLSFGDGPVETEAVRGVGGLAVAVATDEANNGSGRIDEEKRERLLAAGAHVVIPDFRDAKKLIDMLIAP